MDETSFLLQALHDELAKLDAAVVGALDVTSESLSVCNGAAKLRAVVHRDPDAHPAMAHCHITTEMGRQINGQLDACVVGIHPDRPQALTDAARSWVTLVAGPIFSLLHARPVLEASHFDGSQLAGVSGCHGFVGPMVGRFFEKPFDFEELSDVPVFDCVSEMAPPGIVHLAKVTLNAQGQAGWNRNIEVDGHLAAHAESPWPRLPSASGQGMILQFAVFHYADQPGFVERRQQLDEAIRRFVSAFQKTDDTGQAADVMLSEGVENELVNRIAAFAPIAFGRVIFGSLGVSFSPEYIRVIRGGDFQEGMHLVHEPAYARSLMLCQNLITQPELAESVKKIALTGAEIHAINDLLNSGSRPENLRLLPPLIANPDVSRDDVNHALKVLQARTQAMASQTKKPWWRFW